MIIVTGVWKSDRCTRVRTSGSLRMQREPPRAGVVVLPSNNNNNNCNTSSLAGRVVIIMILSEKITGTNKNKKMKTHRQQRKHTVIVSPSRVSYVWAALYLYVMLHTHTHIEIAYFKRITITARASHEMFGLKLFKQYYFRSLLIWYYERYSPEIVYRVYISGDRRPVRLAVVTVRLPLTRVMSDFRIKTNTFATCKNYKIFKKNDFLARPPSVCYIRGPKYGCQTCVHHHHHLLAPSNIAGTKYAARRNGNDPPCFFPYM